jgi:hypothetical protein
MNARYSLRTQFRQVLIHDMETCCVVEARLQAFLASWLGGDQRCAHIISTASLYNGYRLRYSLGTMQDGPEGHLNITEIKLLSLLRFKP